MNKLALNPFKSNMSVYKRSVLTPNLARFQPLSTSNSNKQVTQENIGERFKELKAQRPTSPWTVHQFPLTMSLSIFHRATGVGLGLGFYGLMIAYPAFGLTPEIISSYLSTLPDYVKFSSKFLISFPFMFHNFNGIRHLVWDTASSLTMKGVYSSGYLVLGATVLSSLGLAAL